MAEWLQVVQVLVVALTLPHSVTLESHTPQQRHTRGPLAPLP